MSCAIGIKPSSFTQTWPAATLKGITKGRKWTFDTSSDDTIVSCYYLSKDEFPYHIVSLFLIGEEKIEDKSEYMVIEKNERKNVADEDAEFTDQFMKIGIKVDVKFDKKNCFVSMLSVFLRLSYCRVLRRS